MSSSNGQPSSPARGKSGRTYWASVEHLANSPQIEELIEKEFPNYDPKELLSVSRRRFLKYAAASLALAGVGLSGCRRWPREHVAPYAHDIKDRVPGVADYYATSWELGGVGRGLLVANYDGRPIKIEGNPQHPASVTRSGEWGSADLIDQAQTLSLYDPDRSQAVFDRTALERQEAPGHSVQWFLENVIPQLRSASPQQMAVLSEATASPTVLRLRQMFEQQFPGARWYTYEPLGLRPLAEATRGATGQALRPVYRLDQATVVVSLDEDYLGAHPAHVRYAADWSVLRAAVDDEHPRMSRCYIAECRYSLTGASSDYRLPVRPSRLGDIASAIAAGLGVGGVQAPALEERDQRFVERAVRDLRAAGPSGLLAWGGHLPAEWQVLCMRINEALGNLGTTLTYVADPIPEAGTIDDLTRRMAGGEVQTLLILGGNPVYDAPADLAFTAALGQVPVSVHLSLHLDETSTECTYHVPRAHFLESWGDTRSWSGVIAPTQPQILPLYNGLSTIDFLAALLGLEEDARTLVRQTLLGDGAESADAEDRFREILHQGVVRDSALPPVTPALSGGASPTTRPAVAGAENEFEVVFSADLKLWDGRFANNAWLMEAPDTLTKLTWDNAALMNIEDAAELGVETFDVIEVAVPGAPAPVGVSVYVMPGQPRRTIGLNLGYGRWRAGRIGTVNRGEPGDGGGFYTYGLRTTGGMWFAGGATAAAQGKRYLLAMTQNHHLIDEVGYKGRQDRTGDKGHTGRIVRETSFEEHAHFIETTHAGGNGGGNGHNGHHYPAHEGMHAGVTLQIFENPSEFRRPHAWGMTIDMNTCIGCGACVMACVAENNIPVVGKEQVFNNREMHWLRIDRYFKAEGDDYETQIRDDDPDVVLQPMMCVHCENAPCEQVCPVAATVHDTEGLNVMVYNRCIGTRYCSNNCPYKVRKFNYLDWWAKDPRAPTHDATFLGLPDQQQQTIDAVRRMVFNPEVTVRMRGIMEKCTYCIQRIKTKTTWRRNRDEDVVDGDIKTACQMACPTEAIVFGNLNDPKSRVARQQKLPRAYAVLDDLNTRPRSKHLARLRNRETAIASAAEPAH